LVKAWASHKSFQPKDDGGAPPVDGAGKNPDVDFRGRKRSNDTHASRTDPDARLYKKSAGNASKLGYLGHVLTENRNGLVVDCELTRATGTAEREAALAMLERLPGGSRVTLGADKGYDSADFVEAVRSLNVTPHIAQNDTNRRSAIDARTTRHDGYSISQRKRKCIEEVFGWGKVVGTIRKVKIRGLERVSGLFTFAVAAYNLVRMRKDICSRNMTTTGLLTAIATETRSNRRSSPSEGQQNAANFRALLEQVREQMLRRDRLAK